MTRRRAVVRAVAVACWGLALVPGVGTIIAWMSPRLETKVASSSKVTEEPSSLNVPCTVQVESS